jgi:hypothetical protein
MDRRSFLRGVGLVIASPAIVRAASLMPVRAPAVLTLSEWSSRVLTPEMILREAIETFVQTNRYFQSIIASEAPCHVRTTLPSRSWRL